MNLKKLKLEMLLARCSLWPLSLSKENVNLTKSLVEFKVQIGVYLSFKYVLRCKFKDDAKIPFSNFSKF